MFVFIMIWISGLVALRFAQVNFGRKGYSNGVGLVIPIGYVSFLFLLRQASGGGNIGIMLLIHGAIAAYYYDVFSTEKKKNSEQKYFEKENETKKEDEKVIE
ncbi:hypothetical protein [Enterococcus sp. BWR-S5]|uniref:hypothetical protein n=1 Tax=Enterococcus sp. BWR-S5 TaxID=2787714 RepID=UPI001920E7F7|nr:hypothetical protein [Enterococcus sp. BWR-S5]MBL1225130.1 hypothetical protein [Enterococcus sp. BWR-S5]